MTDLPERRDPPPAPELRASDADRDRVAAVLREAAGDGRISMDELEERLEAVYSAKTYAELEPLTRDLPAARGAAPPVPGTDAWLATGEEPTWRTGIGVLSGFNRVGVWAVPRKFTAFAFWGGGKIDLRDARYTSGEVRIRAIAVMGGVEIIAPDDVTVHVKGLGVMGGFDGRASGPGAPGAPRVVIRGFSFWGGVNVKRRARDRKRGDREDGD
ncbi:hypothetical protein Acsp04_63930 [Actinomadura sp. NBRC 104425]|uniref:DUF1707 SHOCT-like domain-containing protein n=1 Tax=Actinomadura sp. NBRC 104425 TaxID=3032204 RepID=UPI0024A4A022|nr:DUF1707 domain-containing protein [Actinomadura sp. NBRC 104425]GLZ16158.1 hypothetical protein Acsp04_63930 [Actinomadura sp. NBRC 104425]